MITVSVQHTFKEAENWLNDIQRKAYPKSIQYGLNNTASRGRDMLMKEMLSVIDRPTPFTLEAFLVIFAKPSNMTAEIKAKNIQAEYLHGIVYGGTETKAKPIPGKYQKTNQYGNLPRNATKARGTFMKIGDRKHVWKKIGKGKNAKIQVVGSYEHSRTYKPLLHFEKIVEQAVDKWLEHEWGVAFDRQMKKYE